MRIAAAYFAAPINANCTLTPPHTFLRSATLLKDVLLGPFVAAKCPTHLAAISGPRRSITRPATSGLVQWEGSFQLHAMPCYPMSANLAAAPLSYGITQLFNRRQKVRQYARRLAGFDFKLMRKRAATDKIVRQLARRRLQQQAGRHFRGRYCIVCV